MCLYKKKRKGRKGKEEKEEERSEEGKREGNKKPFSSLHNFRLPFVSPVLSSLKNLEESSVYRFVNLPLQVNFLTRYTFLNNFIIV